MRSALIPMTIDVADLFVLALSICDSGGRSTSKSVIKGSGSGAMRHLLRQTCPAKSHTQGHTRRPLPSSWDHNPRHFCGVWLCRHNVHTSWCSKEPHQVDGHTGRKSDYTTDRRPPTPPGMYPKVRRTREWLSSGCRAQTSRDGT